MTLKLRAAMLAFFLAAFLLTVRGHYGSDHFMSYLTAESLVLDQRLAIGVRAFTLPDIDAGLARAPLGADGQRYSLYGLALPLVMAPFYLLGHLAALALPAGLHDYATMFAVSATNAVVTAFTCKLLVAYALRLGYSLRTSFVLALWYGFGTLAWNYSQYSFAEPLLAGCFLAALMALDRWQASRHPGRALFLGFWLGLCLLTEVYAALIMVLAVVVYMLWTLRGGAPRVWARAWGPLALGALPAVAAGLWFYTLRFGPGTVGEARLSGTLSMAFIPVALYGFIFSSGKSFFLYVPPALLGLAGARAFGRRKPALAVMLAGIAAASVLLIASYVNFWHGDFAWGPRFLFHLALLAVLPAAEVLEAGWPGNARQRLAAWALAVGSLVIQLGGVLVNLGRYLQMVFDQRLGDPRFIPYLSPVVGHWLLAASSLSRLATGRSLHVAYPTGNFERPWRVVDLAGYDGFDLWFVNLPAYWSSPWAPWLALLGVLALVATMGLSLAYVWPRLRAASVGAPQPERRATAHQAGTL